MRKSIYSEEQVVLTSLLREMREKAGIKQVDLADRLGRPQSFVSKYESGERRLDLIELRHVAIALGSTLESVVRRFERGLR